MRRLRQPTELMWTLRKHHVTWSCELGSLGEWGFAVVIFRDGDPCLSHRFERREDGDVWAAEYRLDLEQNSPN